MAAPQGYPPGYGPPQPPKQEVSWGSMIGTGLKYAVYGSLLVGAVFAGASVLEHIGKAFSIDSISNVATKLGEITGLSSVFPTTGADSVIGTVGNTVGGWANTIYEGIGKLVGVVKDYPIATSVAVGGAAVLGTAAVYGKHTAKVAQERQAAAVRQHLAQNSV